MITREPRHHALIDARMRCGSRWVDVSIRNIASHGLLVYADDPPPPGAQVEIRRASHVIIGRAVWRHEGDFGVRARDVLDVPAILAGDERPRVAAPAPNMSRTIERRSDPSRRSRADMARRYERSRQDSSTLQFMFVVASGLAAAGFVAGMVYEALSTPFDAVRAFLAG